MVRILIAASVLAVSSNLDIIRSKPYLRLRLPSRPLMALRAQASLHICLDSLALVSPFLGPSLSRTSQMDIIFCAIQQIMRIGAVRHLSALETHLPPRIIVHAKEGFGV